jgi:hypothetical protein
MKKLVLVPMLAGVLVLAGFGASALARGVAWPSTCANPRTTVLAGVRCVDAHLNSLHRQDKTLKRQVAALTNRIQSLETDLACFFDARPISQVQGYGYDSNGDNTVDTTTTAIDLTEPDDPAVVWLAEVDPACVNPAAASLSVRGRG